MLRSGKSFLSLYDLKLKNIVCNSYSEHVRGLTRARYLSIRFLKVCNYSLCSNLIPEKPFQIFILKAANIKTSSGAVNIITSIPPPLTSALSLGIAANPENALISDISVTQLFFDNNLKFTSDVILIIRKLQPETHFHQKYNHSARNN